MVLPLLIPAGLYGGFMLAKTARNSMVDSTTDKPAAKTVRDNGVVDRLLTGATPPVSHFSDQHLERMLRTNSAMQMRSHELREARVGRKPTA